MVFGELLLLDIVEYVFVFDFWLEFDFGVFFEIFFFDYFFGIFLIIFFGILLFEFFKFLKFDFKGEFDVFLFWEIESRFRDVVLERFKLFGFDFSDFILSLGGDVFDFWDGLERLWDCWFRRGFV